MAGLGVPELLILLVIIVLLVGSSQLPRLARSFGQASKEFRAGARERAGTKGGETAD